MANCRASLGHMPPQSPAKAPPPASSPCRQWRRPAAPPRTRCRHTVSPHRSPMMRCCMTCSSAVTLTMVCMSQVGTYTARWLRDPGFAREVAVGGQPRLSRVAADPPAAEKAVQRGILSPESAAALLGQDCWGLWPGSWTVCSCRARAPQWGSRAAKGSMHDGYTA
jgi:hypothetical protein